MAIKVSGTTVIDDSRGLNNIASVDATTVAALGAAGVGGGGGSFDATADGSITAGETVYLKSTGNIDSISNSYTAQNVGTRTVFNANLYVRSGQIFWNSSSVVGAVWQDNSAFIRYAVASVSGNTASFGSSVNVATAYAGGTEGVVSAANGEGTDSGYALTSYRESGGDFQYALLTYSGTTASVVTDGSTNLASINATRTIYCPNDNCWLIGARYSSSMRVYKVTRSGSSLTLSSVLVVLNNKVTSESMDLCYDPDLGRAIAVTHEGYTIWSEVIDVSGTNPSSPAGVQSIVNISNILSYGANPERYALHYDTTNNRNILIGTGNGGQPPFYIQYKGSTAGTFTVTKTAVMNPSEGAGTGTNTYRTQLFSSVFNNHNNAISLLHDQYGGDTTGNDFKVTVSYFVNTDTMSNPNLQDGFRLDSASEIVVPGNERTYKGLAAEPSGDRIALLYRTGLNANPAAMIYNPTITQAFNYIGVASENISSSSTGNVQVLGSVNENQTGLSTGTTYYVGSDGSPEVADQGYGLLGKALSSTKLLIKG